MNILGINKFMQNKKKFVIISSALILLSLIFPAKTAALANPKQTKFTAKIEACDMKSKRKANAIIDVGYGDREYIAKTNANAQLVEVKAKKIIMQNEKNFKNNRYCKEQAHVPGVEDPNLDKGHVIGDQLGGVANVYNITPQNSKTNQVEQKNMEQEIIKALKKGQEVRDFTAKIEYLNNTTMIPSKYIFQYYIGNKIQKYEFYNQHKNNDYSAPKPVQPSKPAQPTKPASKEPAKHPQGATAKCKDGTYSYSKNRKGTCSRHGGVKEWL